VENDNFLTMVSGDGLGNSFPLQGSK